MRVFTPIPDGADCVGLDSPSALGGVGTLKTGLNEYGGGDLVVVGLPGTLLAAPLAGDVVTPNDWLALNECFDVLGTEALAMKDWLALNESLMVPGTVAMVLLGTVVLAVATTVDTG